MPNTLYRATTPTEPVEIDIVIRDATGIDSGSITENTTVIRKQNTNTLLPTTIKEGTLRTVSAKAMSYTALWNFDNATDADNDVYEIVGRDVTDTVNPANTMTEAVLDTITLAIGQSPADPGGTSAVSPDATTGPGQNIALSDRTELPAGWFGYTDASITWGGIGMNVVHAQGTPGFISAIVLGNALTPSANGVVEIDFLGGDPTKSQCVGLGKTEFANGALDFSQALYWSSNGTVLAGQGGTAPLQAIGERYRFRIVFDATASNANLYFFQDTNIDGTYAAMTPASVSVPLSAQIKAGTNIGFDPAETGNLTVQRVYLD